MPTTMFACGSLKLTKSKHICWVFTKTYSSPYLTSNQLYLNKLYHCFPNYKESIFIFLFPSPSTNSFANPFNYSSSHPPEISQILSLFYISTNILCSEPYNPRGTPWLSLNFLFCSKSYCPLFDILIQKAAGTLFLQHTSDIITPLLQRASTLS